MNEPRCAKQFPQGRIEGHEGKKEEESFWCCCGYFCKIGMLPKITRCMKIKLALKVLHLTETAIYAKHQLHKKQNAIYYCKMQDLSK
jgi:hypothetical protein